MSLLNRLGEFDDGSDPALYYSPIRHTGRPIRWILIAYHAFANVLLFYRCCAANGLDKDPYCRLNEKVLVPQLEQLEGALRKSRALTPLGRALWEPLAAKIH
jgi:HEXXH motif-containing protein